MSDESLEAMSIESEKTGGCEHDFPFYDGTDGAHPAWWRGEEHGVRAVVQRLQETADGHDDGAGGFGYPALERLRRSIGYTPTV